MKNSQSPRILFTVLLAEVLLGLFFLVISGGLATILTVFFLVLFVGGGVYVLSRSGLVTTDWIKFDNRSQWGGRWNMGRGNGGNWSGPPQPTNINNPVSGNSGFNLNVGLGINPGLERTETLTENHALPDGTTDLQIEVSNGNLKVVGEVGLHEIRLNAVKRVWEHDEYSARRELERLQVRSRQEGKRFIIEAGQFDQAVTGLNINLGKTPRIDLELVVPSELAASFSTKTGSLELQNLAGEVAARTVAGPMTILNINGGRDLTVGTNSGRISLQQITAAVLRARATTGVLDLTAIGAEALELETMAGSVRARGVNCGRFVANAATGPIELTDVRSDGILQLKATAGSVKTDNVQAAALNLETTTGTIRYRGSAPTAPSQVHSGVGSTDLIFTPGANLNLEARSNVGSVQVFLPVSQTFNNTRNLFRGQIGAGGPLLSVVSQVGSVRISQG